MKRRYAVCRGIAAATLLALSACQTPSPPPAAPSPEATSRWQQHRQALGAIQNFSLQGRIGRGGILGGSGDLAWQERGEQFDVLFSGALGVGAIHVVGTPTQFSVQTRKGEFAAAEGAEVLREQLGWTVPVSSLRYWILGLPRPGAPAALAVDEQGRLLSLDQDGWHLDYREYRSSNDGLELPRKLDLMHDDERLRLLVDRWEAIAVTH